MLWSGPISNCAGGGRISARGQNSRRSAGDGGASRRRSDSKRRIDSLGNFSLRIRLVRSTTFGCAMRRRYLFDSRRESELLDVIEAGSATGFGRRRYVELTTSENGALVRGSTEPGANVVLIPDNGLLMRYSESAANEWGLFAFGAVAPGTYRVISWFDVPPCEIWSPSPFRMRASAARPLM